MATPLDELVIKIVLNGQEFEAQVNKADQGVKKFAQQTVQSATVAERAAQKMVDGFSRVTKEILGVGAAILGVNGLKDLAVNLTQVAAATERMAGAFEIDPEMLNKWQGFLQAVSLQDFSTTAASLGALSRAIQEFRATRQGPLLAAIPWLAKLHISPDDILSGSVSQAVNAMLLKAGANINNPENMGIRTEILGHIPGMTPGMMAGLEKAPTQAELDTYLTATAAQMQSASRMMTAITELAQALTKKLNALLPDAEEPVVSVAKKLGKGDIGGALNDVNEAASRGSLLGQQQIKEAIKDQFERGSWLDNLLMIGGGHHEPDIPVKRSPAQTGVPPTVLDTSTMPTTPRYHDGIRRGGNVIHNNITTHMHGVKTNNPEVWADVWADRIDAALAVHAQRGGT